MLGMLMPIVANAATYVCERAAVPATFTSNGTPRGNWTIQNTANYRYVAASNNDVYQRKTGFAFTVQTVCLRSGPGGWDLGTRNNDYNGLEDACGTWSQETPYAQQGTSCPTSFSLTNNNGTCTKLGIPAHFDVVGAPRGNWTIQNTANYSYVAVPSANGEDFYRNNGRRSNVVSTLCKRTGFRGWDFGDRKNDYNGLNDMCGHDIAATSTQTQSAQCPQGFALVYKP